MIGPSAEDKTTGGDDDGRNGGGSGDEGGTTSGGNVDSTRVGATQLESRRVCYSRRAQTKYLSALSEPPKNPFLKAAIRKC